ncbi:MAG TPA: S-adenosylmethionine:tRNA ribosyltransferase-isomerase [Candidatus Baltobacteraceae bacterium]
MSITFQLPPANEAKTAPERRGLARDGVRLLVTEASTATHRDATFRELPAFLRPGDLLVVNDSATLPAALAATASDGRLVPLHLSTHISNELWLAEPRAPVTAGERATLADGASATFIAPVDAAKPRLWYTALTLEQPVFAYLMKHGKPIRYNYVTEPLALADYQTMFARVLGSAEMPSAGRPFTPRVVIALQARGIGLAAITLHTGVSSAERDERPYSERFAVSAACAAAVNAARCAGGRVIAVGTTVVRALESAVLEGEAAATRDWTDLIVTPKHQLRLVDGLLTGLHEPASSHLDLLRAFLNSSALRAAYGHARDAGYLWHELGDVHLILP